MVIGWFLPHGVWLVWNICIWGEGSSLKSTRELATLADASPQITLVTG